MTEVAGPVLAIALAGWGVALGLRQGVLFLGAGGVAALAAILPVLLMTGGLGESAATATAVALLLGLSLLLGRVLAGRERWWVALATLVAGATVALLAGSLESELGRSVPSEAVVLAAGAAVLAAGGAWLGLACPGRVRGWLGGGGGSGIAAACLLAASAGMAWPLLDGVRSLGGLEGTGPIPGLPLALAAGLAGACSPRHWWGAAPAVAVVGGLWIVWPSGFEAYRLLVLLAAGMAWLLLAPASWLGCPVAAGEESGPGGVPGDQAAVVP